MVETREDLLADSHAQIHVRLRPLPSIPEILAVIAVIIHAIHKLTLVKNIRVHLTAVERPGILVLFEDEGAIAEAFAKVLHWFEPASFKSHVE